MPNRITTYTFEHPSDPELNGALGLCGSFTDEGAAREELQTLLGWTDIVLSPIYMVDERRAAFSAYPSKDAMNEQHSWERPRDSTAPRIIQRNVDV